MKNREISELNDIIHQIDLTDVYRIFHPNATDYTVYPGAHGTISEREHTLGHKANLYKSKKIEITSCVLCYHSAIKLKIDSKQISSKCVESRRLTNY